MPVDHRTSQPFGMLNGGASLALAEIVAGHGSMSLCREGEYACGVQVSGNHLSAVPVGGKVFATGKLIHRGRSSHIWNIDITTPQGELVSTVRVVNFILKRNESTRYTYAKLLDCLTHSRLGFALYRLPWTDECYLVLQTSGDVEQLADIQELNEKRDLSWLLSGYRRNIPWYLSVRMSRHTTGTKSAKHCLHWNVWIPCSPAKPAE